MIPPDDLLAAARRHAADARSLLAAGRADNAMHLAGFAAECALKAHLETHLGDAFQARAFGHDLESLAGRATHWLDAVLASNPLSRAMAEIRHTDLVDGHPGRRYWGPWWSVERAEDGVSRSEGLVERLALARILDEGLAFSRGRREA